MRALAPFFGACLLGALAAIPPALAQQPPAAAAQPGATPSGLEEVVVSAQRRTENLQTTPIAITAISGRSLEVRNLDNIADVGSFVPNTILAPLGAGWGSTMAAYIRGVGLGDNILSFEPGVPIYVDDVYIGRPQGTIFDLLDLERVEVLRGPQGTLFGKNAEGGTVRLISVKPQGDNSGTASLTFGNYNRLEARAVADVALIENTVYARFSFSSKKADGYFKMFDYVCVNGAGSLGSLQPAIAPQSNCVTGTQGDENVQSGRAAFRFLISQNVEFNLVGDITLQNQEGPADKYTVIDGTNGLNAGWGTLTYAPLGVPTAGPAAYIGKPISYDSRFITNTFYSSYSQYGTDPISGRNVPNINDINHWGVAGTLDWKLTDDLTLKSVTAFREFRNQYGRDSDGSPLSENSTYDDAFHQQFSEEITLTGKAGPVDWVTGFFYYHANDSDRGYDVLYPCTAQNPFVCIHEQDDYVEQLTRNWAIFAHGVWHITNAFSVTGGARYTSDEKNATIFINNFDPLSSSAGDVNGQYVPLKTTHPDYDLSFNWQINDALMTYIRYSTGFKGGGFSPRPADAYQTLPFKPEYLRTAELGGKWEFWNQRARFNSAIFYSRYLDQQTFAQQLDPMGVNWFRTENAGTARLWGVEGELQAEPVDAMRLDASFGYVNYELLDNGGNTLLFTGDQCNGERCYSPRTPKFTGALGAQYGMPMAGGELTPRLDYTYQTKIYFVTNNGCFTTTGTAGCGTGAQGAYGVLNARLTWASPGNKWETSLWGRNLTGKEYFYGKLSLISFFGREQGNPAPPLEFGVTFKRNF
ncbi:MAG TPA: TonB-dependent receptor [Steroidobacteraceae bacterium]|nr:TonB-dependent receptor [Steroidobacteraceae bacterium]